jgi:transposase
MHDRTNQKAGRIERDLLSGAERLPMRLLPKDFPPYPTVQHYFYPWRDSALWRQIVSAR